MVTLAVFDCWVTLIAPRSKLIEATLSTTVPTGVPSDQAGMLHKVSRMISDLCRVCVIAKIFHLSTAVTRPAAT